MTSQLFGLLYTTGFPARWHCGRWSTQLGWLHILSDIAIFGAYMAIPARGLLVKHPGAKFVQAVIRQEISEQMHASPVKLGGTLDSADQLDVRIAGFRLCLVIAGECVVVGDGYRYEPGISRPPNQLARGARAVGLVRVGMKINQIESGLNLKV